MINFNEIYLYTDQPFVCPKCGCRTDVILDLSHTAERIQVEKCLSINCSGEFVIQKD